MQRTTTQQPPGERGRLPGAVLFVLFCAFSAFCTVGTSACFAQGSETEPRNEKGREETMVRWKEVDRLVDEQKYEAASEIVLEVLESSRAAADEATWARALIKATQLRLALHGYERGVLFLQGESWPEGPRHRLVLGLFYGHTLSTYLRAYSWQIRQREEVAGAEDLSEQEISTWTQEQILAEIDRAYAGVFAAREAWGAESLGELSAYIEPGNYPAHIRGTLRDAVSYAWADLLADTSLWPPEASNEIYRLDLEALLAEAESFEGEAFDADEHPLLTIRRVLADLEAWHLEERRPEAALEARLELLRHLRASFSSHAEDRARLRSHLENRLGDFDRALPWYAMGASLLAEMQRDESEDAMALVKARDTARAALALHPESLGGRRCRHLAEALEAPQFSLASMGVDGAERRSIEITHANAESVHLRAWPVDLFEKLRGNNPRWQPTRQEVELLLRTEPAARWSKKLPPTPDLRSHRTFVAPPGLEPGAYVVAGSLRRDFKGAGNIMSAALFVRSDLVLTVASLPGEESWEITARDGLDGRPVEAEIEVLRLDWRSGSERIVRQKADAGTLRVQAPERSRYRHVAVGRLSRSDGEHVAIAPIYGHPAPAAEQEMKDALIYTDRSVYRPGQEVLFKVVAYKGILGDYETAAGMPIEVTLSDANGEEVEVRELATNDFGSASGRFEIPPGRLLGGWRLTSSWGGWSAVQVEEYKRPSFEVEIDEPTAAMRLNEPATLAGRADYYFGLPVSAGSVRWRVSRIPYFPPWRWWFEPPQSSPRVIAHGETSIGSGGGFEIVFTPEADERLDRDVSYRYRIQAEVTDEGGETRQASRSVRIGFAAVEASIDTAEPFGRAGEKTEITITRRRLDGAGAAGAGRYRVTRIDEPAEAPLPSELPVDPPRIEGMLQTEGDRLRPRWQTSVELKRMLHYLAEEGEGAEVASGELEHGGDGAAQLALALPGGSYRLHYTTEDDFGQQIERQAEFIVVDAQDVEDAAADSGTSLELPLVLQPQSASVEVGETLELLVHSGFAGQAMRLEVFHGEKRLVRRDLEASDAPQIVELPISREERGGVGVTLTALRDHQLMRLTETVDVPWTDRRLELSFETFRDRLAPGAKETFSVVVHGPDDASIDPATSELLAYMYDRSLDLFAEHAPPRPISLYPQRATLPGLESNLGQAPILWQQHQLPRPVNYPTLHSASLRFLDGWPIGGPGRRGARLQMMRPMAMKAAPPPPSPPSPGQERITVTAEAPMMESAAMSSAAAFDAADGAVDDTFAGETSAGETAAGESEPLRSDFAETAFFYPHLRLDKDGAVRFEFTVPDSVTEWSVWAHALTRDLRSGQITKTTRSVKDLLIRPYLPRFLREGDRAELRLVISNAGETDFAGTADVTIEDPEEGTDLLAAFGLAPAEVSDLPFEVEAGGTTTLTVPLRAPRQPRPVEVTARARAGELADGERRPLPVLPSRLHLAQSRFKTLQGPAERTLFFEDLSRAAEDPSLESESLVVTLDGQLFGSVLRSLPYLVEYPYKCTEQTLNRYLSTGILTGLYDRHPSVAELAERLASERETPLEPWREDDPNRRLLLEETPWLRHARGGEAKEGLLKVLDPEIAEKVRAKALGELREIQTASGAFPWWPGGPPSPFMTFYVLQGFARGLEFDLDVPKEMTVSAWRYLEEYWRQELSRRLDEEPNCCAPRLTFFAWLLWAYPDASWTGGVFTDEDRRHILERAAAHWKEISPRLKGYLALALERAGEGERATLVWESVMDSAKTDEDLGTYWAPEDRAWLWYNDTVETHAFALRVLMALEPDDPRRHGLAQWLLLDKKLGHWKSTRATAEAVYGLAAYMQAEGTLGADQRATVELGERRESFLFEPQEDGRRQIVVDGPAVEPSMASIEVQAETEGFLFASATWHFATDRLPEEARGDFFTVERSYFRRVQAGDRWRLEPLEAGDPVEVGDQVEVKLRIRAKHAAEYVHLRDPRGAGFEPEDTQSGYAWDQGLGHYREIRDSAVNYFFEWLPAGEYDFRYRLRAATAGTFRVGPAQLQSMYAPEFVAYSSGRELVVEGDS